MFAIKKMFWSQQIIYWRFKEGGQLPNAIIAIDLEIDRGGQFLNKVV